MDPTHVRRLKKAAEKHALTETLVRFARPEFARRQRRHFVSQRWPPSVALLECFEDAVEI